MDLGYVSYFMSPISSIEALTRQLTPTSIDRKDVNPERIHRARLAVNEATSRDRGLEIDFTGIDMEAYRKNPLVLWCHDKGGTAGMSPNSGLPIGRSVSIDRLDNNTIESEFEFVPDDPMAARIENMWKLGYLNAASIGLLPRQVKNIESPPAQQSRAGPADPGYRQPTQVARRRVETSEMIEWSCCAVPADPDALAARFIRSLEAEEPGVTGSMENQELLREIIKMMQTQAQAAPPSAADPPPPLTLAAPLAPSVVPVVTGGEQPGLVLLTSDQLLEIFRVFGQELGKQQSDILTTVMTSTFQEMQRLFNPMIEAMTHPAPQLVEEVIDWAAFTEGIRSLNAAS